MWTYHTQFTQNFASIPRPLNFKLCASPNKKTCGIMIMSNISQVIFFNTETPQIRKHSNVSAESANTYKPVQNLFTVDNGQQCNFSCCHKYLHLPVVGKTCRNLLLQHWTLYSDKYLAAWNMLENRHISPQSR